MSIKKLLLAALALKASDIHLATNEPPRVRIDGRICAMPFIINESFEMLLDEIIPEKAKKEFSECWETDFAFDLKEEARFRVNLFRKQGGMGAVFRVIPHHILSLDDLHLPPVLKEIALLPRGLVLITGPSGMGKSTTLAALVHHINQNTCGHIITIEDPIEFIHTPVRCMISQREVYRDTHGFSAALRSSLREDPNVILVGELRDLETMRLAITAAETGHLVLATLHTASAEKTIHRLIHVFPGNEQAMIRQMLSESLEAIIAQTLVTRVDKGRIAAVEIMLATPAIRHLIREEKHAQIVSVMQTNKAMGMQTLDQHLEALAQQGLIQ